MGEDNIINVSEFLKSAASGNVLNALINLLFGRKISLNNFQIENEMNIKKDIIEREDLTINQRIALNAVIKKSLIEFQRQMEILKIAANDMDTNASIDNLNEDWVLDFFDKASRISEDATKQLWGKLLSHAASNKNICSKTLLNSLFLMGTEDIDDFMRVCEFCFSEMNVCYQTKRISAYPIIYFTTHVNSYQKYQISSLRLNRLQILGLLEVDMKSEYVFSQKKMILIYKDKKVEIEHDGKIYIGNVRFTYEGFLLYQMIEKRYNDNLLNYTMEIWLRRGYKVYLNEHRAF